MMPVRWLTDADFRVWHVCDMPTGAEDARLRGEEVIS